MKPYPPHGSHCSGEAMLASTLERG
jgi:hypothetical protein